MPTVTRAKFNFVFQGAVCTTQVAKKGRFPCFKIGSCSLWVVDFAQSWKGLSSLLVMGIDIFQVGRIVCQVPCKLQEGQAINYVDHAIVC